MHKSRFSKIIAKTLLSVSACALLAACQTNEISPSKEERDTQISAALDRAALTAAKRSGNTNSLPYLEKVYKRNSTDAQAAIDYGAALREADYLNRSALVLQPFADDDKSPADAKTEYAAVKLAQGEYEIAEEYAQQAVLQDDKNYRAYHYLGIALDAQGMHEEGERAFRKALDYWHGDPTTVMNNLALNLAAQNYLEEASEILQKAQAVAPNRLEIERNLRIVTALQQSTGWRAPKPHKKPEPPPAVAVEEVTEEEIIEEMAEEITPEEASSEPIEIKLND